MKIKKGFELKEIGGKTVAVPNVPRDDFKCIKLNETAVFLWNFYHSDHDLDDGINALISEYDVDEHFAKRGVISFIERLRANEILDE